MRLFKTLIEDKIQGTFDDPRQVSMDMHEIRCLLQQVEKDKLDFETQESERQEDRFRAVRDWIAAADTVTVHKEICHDRNQYQNSGLWILENIMVREWIHADPDESSGAILWINGRPGAGKKAVVLDRRNASNVYSI